MLAAKDAHKIVERVALLPDALRLYNHFLKFCGMLAEHYSLVAAVMPKSNRQFRVTNLAHLHRVALPAFTVYGKHALLVGESISHYQLAVFNIYRSLVDRTVVRVDNPSRYNLSVSRCCQKPRKQDKRHAYGSAVTHSHSLL